MKESFYAWEDIEMTDYLALAERLEITPLEEALKRLAESTPDLWDVHYADEVRRIARWALDALEAANAALREAHATIQKRALEGITAFDENRELFAEVERLTKRIQELEAKR